MTGEINSFEQLDLTPEVLKAVRRMGFFRPHAGTGQNHPCDAGRARRHC